MSRAIQHLPPLTIDGHHRIQADGARLPIANMSAAAVVLINAFLFPEEVERVLSPRGHWCVLRREEKGRKAAAIGVSRAARARLRDA